MSKPKPENLAKHLENQPPIYDGPKQTQAAINRASYNRSKIEKGLLLDQENQQWQSIYETTVQKWNKVQAKVEMDDNGSTRIEVNSQNAQIPVGPLGSINAPLVGRGIMPTTPPASDAVLLHDINMQTQRKEIDAAQVVAVKQLDVMPNLLREMNALTKAEVDRSEKYFLELTNKYDVIDRAKDATIEKQASIIAKQGETIEKLYGILGKGIEEIDIVSVKRLISFKQLLADIKEGKLNAKDESTVGKIVTIVKDIKPLLEEVAPVVVPLLGGAAKMLGLPFKIDMDK